MRRSDDELGAAVADAAHGAEVTCPQWPRVGEGVAGGTHKVGEQFDLPGSGARTEILLD